ncbi:MAG: hypothetical protein ACOCV4_04430 [Myxococcota bacterium]
MAYHGTERRIHKVFVTRNTEYHLRRDLCVAVRDRRSGDWLRGHLARGSRVSGGIRFSAQGGIVPNVGTPSIGESLFFEAGGRDLVTSPLVAVERPAREVVSTYP